GVRSLRSASRGASRLPPARGRRCLTSGVDLRWTARWLLRETWSRREPEQTHVDLLGYVLGAHSPRRNGNSSEPSLEIGEDESVTGGGESDSHRLGELGCSGSAASECLQEPALRAVPANFSNQGHGDPKSSARIQSDMRF